MIFSGVVVEGDEGSMGTHAFSYKLEGQPPGIWSAESGPTGNEVSMEPFVWASWYFCIEFEVCSLC